MTRKSFSGSAVPTTLTAGCSPTDMTMAVGATTNWPDTTVGPFIITLDRGQGTLQEKVEISSFSGGNLNVSERGADGTTAQSHSMGATAVCTLDAATINLHDEVVAGVGTVTPSTSAVGDSAVEGTQVLAPAAGDHKHARESFGTSATTSAVADAEAAGSASTPSRSDHKHGREGFGSGQSQTASYTNADGSNTTLARSNHTHAVALTHSAGHLASPYTLTTSLATFMTTASLAVGTWLVSMSADVYDASSGSVTEITMTEGTATASFEGCYSTTIGSEVAASGTNESPGVLTFIATVTVAGTLAFEAITSSTVNAPIIRATSRTNTYINATGYTAVRLA